MPKTTRNIGLSELRVGLLVLIAIAILVVLILNASGTLNPFASHLHLRARFNDANGLREGSEVRLAGVRIGKVDRIELLKPSDLGNQPNPQKVQVYLSVDTKIDGSPATERIRTDSTDEQASPSILGSEMLVNITPGTSLGQPVTENFLLPSTSGSTMADLATSGTDLAQRLSKLSDQLSEVVKNVREGKGTVGRLFNDESLYNNLNATIHDAEDLAQQIKSGKGTAGKFIYDEELYNTTTTRIDNVVAGAQRGEGTLGKLITDEQLYNNVNNLSSEGVKLIYDFRQNPKKYLTIKFQLF